MRSVGFWIAECFFAQFDLGFRLKTVVGASHADKTAPSHLFNPLTLLPLGLAGLGHPSAYLESSALDAPALWLAR